MSLAGNDPSRTVGTPRCPVRNPSVAGAPRPAVLSGGVAGALLVITTALAAGCERGGGSSESPAEAVSLPALEALGEDVRSAVVAQGQLEPAGGVFAIMAPAGDRIVSVEVDEGAAVREDETLAVLQGSQMRQQELAVARVQLEEAKQQAASERRVAEAKLDVADVELKSARLQLSQAKDQFERAEAEGGRLDLLKQRVTLAENKLAQLREAAGDPSAERLVSASTLDQQALEADQARAEWEAARQEFRQRIEVADLAVEAARRELKAAETSIDAGQQAMPLRSLEQQIELLKLQVEAHRLLSPIRGTVLSVDVAEGEATTGAPLMRIADTGKMICRAEVNVADVRRFAVGAKARVSSPALPTTLGGRVRSISRLIGSPQLADPYPMAQVDWRSAEVIIDIDEQDAAVAAELIHLQVDVAIKATAEAARANEAAAADAEAGDRSRVDAVDGGSGRSG